jgi:hypothetical protein
MSIRKLRNDRNLRLHPTREHTPHKPVNNPAA